MLSERITIVSEHSTTFIEVEGFVLAFSYYCSTVSLALLNFCEGLIVFSADVADLTPLSLLN